MTTTPTRSGSGSGSTRTTQRASTAKTATKTSAKTSTKTDRTERAAPHARSAAAERAYARRAGRGPSTQPPKTERKSGASKVSFVILVMGLLVVGVVATLWLSTQSTADSYQLAQVEQNTQNLAVRVQQLQQQVAQAESPGELAKLAQQLGMVPANNFAHLVVGQGGAVSVVGTPSAATAPPPPVPTTTPTTSTSPSGSAQTSSPAAPPASETTQSTAGG